MAARYAGSPQLEAKMEEAVRAHQSAPLSISTALDAAKLLEHVILVRVSADDGSDSLTWQGCPGAAGVGVVVGAGRLGHRCA